MDKNTAILREYLEDIETYTPYFLSKNERVSGGSVGWHLDHTLKVVNGVLDILNKTKPENFKKEFKLSKLVIFSLGFIPRGKARAPKIVLPPETILESDLKSQLLVAYEKLNFIKNIHPKAYFKHHIFGTLDKQQTLRFLEIHTKHHLKIVKDILDT